ncbi:MAG TPA: hypothetical protein VII12_15380 [Thermoanaerobaculia bacterium]
MDKNSFFARTMHTPDSPERAKMRDALREISRALIPLHKRLIDAAKNDYAFAYEAEPTPGQLLNLLQSDPFFAWLKPLTTIIVDIDEMARTDFDAAQALAVGARLERLFAEQQYVEMLQREVDIAIGHAALRRTLQRLTSDSGQ